jgi:hypothetical protein
VSALLGDTRLDAFGPDRLPGVGVDRTEVGQLIEPRLTSVSVDLLGTLATFLGEVDLLLPAASTPSVARALADPATFVTLELGESS